LAVVTILVTSATVAVWPEAGSAPVFGEVFWDHWGDGKAELAGYELTYPRYGKPRAGTAVTIFVTETFDNPSRVKSERPGGRADQFPVMKLNLVQDFATGVYDYNLMTSAFVALEAVNGRAAGESTKIVFSSQEWCGQTYAQALFDDDAVRVDTHSYFEGEADRSLQLDHPDDGLAEDSLLLWARGFAAPRLAPGESVEVPLFRSLEGARIRHEEPRWITARLSRSTATKLVSVPAGEFLTTTLAARAGSVTWTFDVETDPPHRLVRWGASDGLEARLVAAARLEYWAMNGPGFEEALGHIGLAPRPVRTP
jgi:hypothetical protein